MGEVIKIDANTLKQDTLKSTLITRDWLNNRKAELEAELSKINGFLTTLDSE